MFFIAKKVNLAMQIVIKNTSCATRVCCSPMTPSAVSMALHPFCSHIISELSLLGKAHLQALIM